MTDPLGPLRDLRRRLAAEAASRGLTLIEVAFVAGDSPADDNVRAIFHASESALRASPEALADRVALADMAAAERALQDQAEIEAARADLDRRLAEGGDLLGDA